MLLRFFGFNLLLRLGQTGSVDGPLARTRTCLGGDAGAVAQFAGPASSVARQEPRLLGPVALHLGRRSVLLDPDVVAGLQLRAAQR